MQGSVGMAGALQVKKIEGAPVGPLTATSLMYFAAPRPGLAREVLRWRLANWPRLLNQIWRWQLMRSAGRLSGYPFMSSRLWLKKIDGRTGEHHFYGLASLRVVTNAGRDELVDEFDAATAAGFDLTTFNFHALGTGGTAEAAADTALVTELTTEYGGNVRATGTQSQPASSTYRSLATNTLDSGTPAITEHGLMSQAATGGGVLWDRSLFAAINLNGVAGDSLQTTYDVVFSSGG